MKHPWLKKFAWGVALGMLAFLSVPATEWSPRAVYREKASGVVIIFARDGSAAGELGSGFFVTPTHVLTNAHVVVNPKTSRPYQNLAVYLRPDKVTGRMGDDLVHRYKAELVAHDEALDLALLSTEADRAHVVLAFADSEHVEIGDPVLAIGHPEQGGFWTLTTGSVSSFIRDFSDVAGKDVIQTEASINRGNSGGPLLEAGGRVVGVNTMVARQAPDGMVITDVNFALTSMAAYQWATRAAKVTLPIPAQPAPVTVAPEPQAAPAPPPPPPPAPPVEAKHGEGCQCPKCVPPAPKAEAPAKPEAPVKPEAPAKAEEAPVPPAPAPAPKAEEKPAATFPPPMKPVAPPPQVEKPAPPAPKPEVKPEILTEVRPYNPDEAWELEMKHMEDMMDDMRKRIEQQRKSAPPPSDPKKKKK